MTTVLARLNSDTISNASHAIKLEIGKATHIGTRNLLNNIMKLVRLNTPDEDVVAELIELGADVHEHEDLSRYDSGYTPLIYAVRLGSEKLVKVMLEHGAKPCVCEISMQGCADNYVYTSALEFALYCRANSNENIINLLLDHMKWKYLGDKEVIETLKCSNLSTDTFKKIFSMAKHFNLNCSQWDVDSCILNEFNIPYIKTISPYNRNYLNKLPDNALLLKMFSTTQPQASCVFCDKNKTISSYVKQASSVQNECCYLIYECGHSVHLSCFQTHWNSEKDFCCQYKHKIVNSNHITKITNLKRKNDSSGV